MKTLCSLLAIGLCAAGTMLAQQAGVPPAAAPPAAATAITTDDIKNVETPKPDVRVKGDPDGSLTGNAGDIGVSDSKRGLTVPDVLNQVGQNKIAINFTWTLI